MENKNNFIKILLNIAIVALITVIGFMAGRKTNRSAEQPVVNLGNESKLDYILSLIGDKYVERVSIDSLVEESIPLILERLDPHSSYIPAKDMASVNEPLNGSFEGIGVTFNMLTDTIVVINTIVGGPSDRAGIESGDRIIRINDSVVAGRKIATDSIMRMLRGKANTKVLVDIKRSGFDKEIPFEITRGKIPLKSVDVSYMINDSIGYIKMSKFARTTHKEFVDAVKKLNADAKKNNLDLENSSSQNGEENVKTLIVDLRENTGGYLDQVLKIADEFFGEKVTIVYTEGAHSPRKDMYSTKRGLCKDMAVYILIDEASASASEILSGAIQDNDRGTIVGRRSFGKGLVQEPIFFDDGSGINITIARYYTPSGRCIQKPYNKGFDEYNKDLYNRYLHDEFYQQDSIHFNDSLKYITPKGKVVYGGGGIMPDVFVALDTIGFSNTLFRRINQKNLVYKFVLNFSDSNRDALRTFTNFADLDSFLSKQKLFEKFTAYMIKNGVTPRANELKEARPILEPQIYGLIGRNSPLDDEGYYPYYQKVDKTLLRAIELAEGGK